MASMGDMGARWGMLIVETIAKVRRAYFLQKKPIKAICREFRLSRKVVRKVIRSEATEFAYERDRQPLPKIGPWRDRLDGLLLANEQRAARERLTLVRVFEELPAEEVAARMERTPGAVRMLQMRALTALREALPQKAE